MDFKRKSSHSPMFFLGHFPQLILALRNNHFHQKCWKSSCIFHSGFSTSLTFLKWWIVSLCLSVVLYSPWMMKWLQWHTKREKTGQARARCFYKFIAHLHFPTCSYIICIHKLFRKEVSSEVTKFSGGIKFFRVVKAKYGCEKLQKLMILNKQ